MHSKAPATPTLISQPNLCILLDKSRSGLAKLRAKDPSFPKPIKDGKSKQAACYYLMSEVESWITSRKLARDVNVSRAKGT